MSAAMHELLLQSARELRIAEATLILVGENAMTASAIEEVLDDVRLRLLRLANRFEATATA